MRKFITLLFILLIAQNGQSFAAKCPNVDIVLSPNIQYAECCREHSLDGWDVSFSVINKSLKPFYLTGFWVDGRTVSDPKFFLARFL